MGNSTSSLSTIQSRGLVEIVYSTTSGTSKVAADKLQQILQDNKYLAPVINIGDYTPEDLFNNCGTVILLLSTYGDGSSPSDGQTFLSWIQKLVPSKQCFNLHYSIMAFGNSSFQNHCGFALKTEKVLKSCGANQILQLIKCDAGSQDKNVDAKFPAWSKALVQKLNQNNPLRQISKSCLGNPYQVTLSEKSNLDWESSISNFTNIGQQFSSYWAMHKCRIIDIQQLRTNEKDGRSTLRVRIESNKNLHIDPACNIDIFPINSLQNDPRDHQIVSFNEVKGKMPYPPMPLREIRKLLDYRQKASNKQIKNALLLSTCDQSVTQQYNKKLKEKGEVTIKELIDQLKPKLEFIPFVNLNRVRPYTLSSWDPQNKYIDLTVAISPKGLTSNYLKSYPEFIRIKPISSSFYIPEGRPIVMIANGSGIAPFRSIVQYVASLPQEKRQYMRLYFGIQSRDVDYYYKNEWIEYQKQKIIQIKLAESRRDPNNKKYVQHILQEDVQWLQEHFFKNNGVVFICGSGSMCQDINNVIFKSLAIQTKIPYKAFALAAQLKQKKTIVEQAFD